MTNKLKAITNAVFYAHQSPEKLAELIEPLIEDKVDSVSIDGPSTIKLVDNKSATASYTAEALSQFGDVMTTAPTITLKESVTGISLASGTVTVANTVTNGTQFELVATSGTITSSLKVTVTVAE